MNELTSGCVSLGSLCGSRKSLSLLDSLHLCGLYGLSGLRDLDQTEYSVKCHLPDVIYFKNQICT